MMIGFQRGEGIKTSLGLGEYDQLFKKLVKGLDGYFLGKEIWSTDQRSIPHYSISWKHKIDRGGGNCHAIAGLVDRKTLGTPIERDIIMMARRHLKRVFSINGCKMISIDSYPDNKKKIYEKYEFGPDKTEGRTLIVVKYAKLK